MKNAGKHTLSSDTEASHEKGFIEKRLGFLNPEKLLLMLIVMTASLSFCNAKAEETGDSATVLFRQSQWKIDTALGNNSRELERLTRFLNRCNSEDSLYSLRNVRVVGGASPEGSISINDLLSRRRAESLFDYIDNGRQIPDSIVSFKFLGRDWEGLRRLVEFDTRVPYRPEVLDILDRIISAGPESEKVSDTGLRQLKALRGGIPYRYLMIHEFPEMRASEIFVDYTMHPVPAALEDSPEDNAVIPDTVGIVTISEEVVEVQPQGKPFYMDIRTNMLYDALAIPSIGAEFYLGRNWSAGINWMYGWWKCDHRHRYWRAYGGDINVRRWFGRKADEKPLTGHHLGLYAGVVTYDFEWGGKGYMGGVPKGTLWDRCNFLCGVEYGYSLPVARRLNIDFTIGIGYLGGKYIEYTPENDIYVWRDTKRFHWFGPTKAEISLVWLLGKDNVNNRAKGGNL